MSILLAPADLRKVSGETGKLVKSVQDSVREVEKLDLKAEQTLADEFEREAVSFLAGNIYTRAIINQGGRPRGVPWLSVADQDSKQNVKNVASGMMEEINSTYNSLNPRIEAYRLVRGNIHKYLAICSMANFLSD